jgi:hypothetical protein
MAAKGLQALYNLILKDVVKGSGQASGIMSIGKDVRKLADKKLKRYIDSAKKQGVDLNNLSEQEAKYMLELNKPKPPKVYSNEEAYEILSRFANKNRRGKVIKADFGKPFAEEIVTVERVITDIKKLEPIEAMKEANRVLKGEGRYKNLSKADREKIAMDESVTDHIFERNIVDETEDFAQGGRTGLSYLLAEDTNERMPFKMGRRAFLKLMGSVGAGIGAAKAGLGSLFKAGKPVTKTAEIITTPNVPGKPEWFDALVTRIVNEGEDVTKQFAYKERMKVHTKPISKTEEVTVYRDLDDNSVRVNYGQKLKIDETKPYEQGNIGRASNDPDQIDLIVREGEVIEPDLTTGKGGGKTKASFEASEAEPRVANPDGDIEFDGIREVNNVDDLMQDVSSLEEFATRKKLTGEKATKAKKKQEDFQRFTENQVEQAEYLETKYGPGDYASGGLAKMLGE